MISLPFSAAKTKENDMSNGEMPADSIGTTCMVTIGYPLVMTNSLLLKMAIEIVDLPINSMVDLSIVTLVYQRVHGPIYSNIIQLTALQKSRKFTEYITNFIHFPILSQ